jgi:tetratricopeptide (TPR) repeat protein
MFPSVRFLAHCADHRTKGQSFLRVRSAKSLRKLLAAAVNRGTASDNTVMDEPGTSAPGPAPAGAASALETAVQRCVAARLKFWALAIGLPLLFLMANLLLLAVFQTRQVAKLTRELEALRASTVQFGNGIEIYNPAWGTVLDAVDPARLPSRDARDPRYGAIIQQYTPRGNEAQLWQLRPPSGRGQREAPLPLEAYLRHGFSFMSARDYNRAVLAFENCVRLYPDAAAAHDALGRAQRDKNEFAQALLSHDRAVELEPTGPQFRWERAITRLRANDAEGAIKDCQDALTQNGEFADAHNTLAIVYRDRKDFPQALKHHDRAVELNPQREDFWRERGITHGNAGDQQKAAADAARAQELRNMRK